MIRSVQSKSCSFGNLYIKSDVRNTLENEPLDKVREVIDCANRLRHTENWNAELSKDSVKIFSNDGLTLNSPFVFKRDVARPYVLHIGDEKNLEYCDLFREKIFNYDTNHIQVNAANDINSTATSRLMIMLESLSPLKQATEIISYLENKNGLFVKFIVPSPERQHIEKVVVKQLVDDLFEKHGVE